MKQHTQTIQTELAYNHHQQRQQNTLTKMLGKKNERKKLNLKLLQRAENFQNYLVFVLYRFPFLYH